MKKDVLDYGWVELLDVMGSDLSVAEAARVSTGTTSRGWKDGDGKLTEYLWSNRHLSPFEMVEVKFAIKAPIFIARQWMRHRAGSFNEFSMRYAEAGKIGLDVYTPLQWRGNDSNNKQSSSGTLVLPTATTLYDSATHQAVTTYLSLLAKGVSREQARLVLPVSVYTKFYWKVDFRNFAHFINLRKHEDAQLEMQEYAEACKLLVAEKLPHLVELCC